MQISSIMYISAFRKIYKELDKKGKVVSPRGLKILEIENYNYTLEPYERFISFESRKLNVSYIKKEFLWYLRGDRFDSSIVDHAKIWKTVMNQDGSINSNYGQYIFKGGQYDNVVKILSEDRDSRRASIAILDSSHLQSDSNDIPCTYSMNFRIRKDRLNMTVRMRSQDAIYGMSNDVPSFSFIHEMLLHSLRKTYPALSYGTYYHSVDSFHVYEKHFTLLKKLIKDKYFRIECPKISGSDEVDFLKKGDFNGVPEDYKFTLWLLN